MRLIRLLERNWCQHREREIRFDPGLNVFLGANGTGKSTALNGALFALTGDFSRSDGNKAVNITQHVPEDESSFVELDFSHGDFTCSVQRFLRGGQTSLTICDSTGKQLEKPVRGDNKVTARLLELLGTTERILSDYVFVGQGAMFAPFAPETSPADRARAFQRLFGIEQAEAIWAAIGEHLATLPAIVVPDLTAYEQEHRAAAAETTRLESLLAPLRALLTWRRELDPDADVLARHAKAQAASGRLSSLLEQRRSRVREGRQLRQERREALEAIRLFSAAVSSKAPRQAEWQEVVRLDNQRAGFERSVRESEQLLTNLTLERNRLQHPTGAAGGLTADYLQQSLHALDVDISTDSRYVNNFATGSGGRCPTCHTPVAEFSGVLEQTRQRLLANQQTRELLMPQLEAAKTYERQLQEYGSRLTWLNQQIELATVAASNRQAELALLPDNVAADAARTSLLELQSWQNELRVSQTVLGTLITRLTTIKSDYRQAGIATQQLQAEIAAGGSAEEAAAAESRLRQKAEQSLQAASLSGQFEAAKSAEQSARTRLEAANQSAVAARHQQFVRTRLGRIRDVLHRDRLPQLVIQRQLDRLGQATNEVLSSFGAQYRLSPAEGLSYRADFFDGRQQPVTRLSGGEQVLTALAFRIATNATFARELGMLCLDEPTVYLDADNLGCLDAALDWLRQASRSRGLQCVLITHEKLGHLFDHVENF